MQRSLGLGLITLLLACDDPEASKQHHGTINLPKPVFDTAGYGLDSEDFNTTFSGSTIIWQEEPPASALASIAMVSSKLIQNGAAQLRYLDAKVLPEIQNLQQELEVTQKLGKELYVKSFEQSLQRAALWFGGTDGRGGQVGAAAAQIKRDSASDLPMQSVLQANQNFGLYCQAKIWERALQKQLINETYKQVRPTPSSICEGVYARLGLLNRDSPRCRADGEYRSYLGCLWHEGVRKTTLWTERYPPGSPVDQVLSGLTDEELVTLFIERRQGQRFLAQRGMLLVGGLGGSGVEQVDIGYQTTAQGLAAAPVSDILAHTEKRAVEDDGFRYFPREDYADEVKQVISKAEAELRAKIRFMNLLGSGFYVNENQFNRPFQKPSLVSSDIQWSEDLQRETVQKFAEIFSLSDPQLLALQQSFEASKTKLSGDGVLIRSLLRELDPAGPCAKKDSRLICEYQILSAAAKDNVRPVSVTQAVWQSQIRLYKSPDGTALLAEVKLNKARGHVLRACARLSPDASCPSGLTPHSDFVFDPDTGLLSITLQLSDAETYGLTPSSRSEFDQNLSFSDLDEQALKNSTVRIESYLGTVDGVLRVMIGEVSIEKDGVLRRGSIKFRDELPPQQKAVRDFLSSMSF